MGLLTPSCVVARKAKAKRAFIICHLSFVIEHAQASLAAVAASFSGAVSSDEHDGIASSLWSAAARRRFVSSYFPTFLSLGPRFFSFRVAACRAQYGIPTCRDCLSETASCFLGSA